MVGDMHNKCLAIVMMILFLSFNFTSNVALAAVNTNKPDETIINKTGKSLSDFIPKKWKLISEVRGDLNKDKLKDIAAVIEYTGKYDASLEEEMVEKPRIMFVIFKTKKGAYKLSVQSSSIIMTEGAGGVYGDPFAGIEYSRGSIVISLYGGSAWRWGYTYRFRYQDKGWYLIGETIESSYTLTGECEIVDTNCLTGKQITTSIDINGKKKIITRNVGKKKLKKLTDF